MLQAQVQLANMPLTLVLLSDGSVVVVITGPCPVILEQGSKVNALFLPDRFIMESGDDAEEFSYRAAYLLSDYPLLKQWLIQQELPNPF